MAFLLKHLFPHNASFGFEALRAADYSNFGAADLAEVIAVCARIPPGDEDRWLQEWREAGDRAAANAETSLRKGNKPGARDAFLRASNYYRTAEFYRRDSPFEDDLSKKLADLSADMYFAAVEYMPYVVEKVKISYEDTTLPGVFIRPKEVSEPRATIIVNGGFDSTKEEVSICFGTSVLDGGFNVLAFDGPGQGEALRKQRLFFRHDWEKVLTPVMDYTLARPEVDKAKIVVYGLSMGGYLVARGAAYEHRAAAIILNDGVFDFGSAFNRETPYVGKVLLRNRWDGTINQMVNLMMKTNTGMKWAILNSKWVYGLSSEADVLREAEKYTLEGVVENIKTPTLVLDAPDDHFLAGQPEILYERLKCDKSFVQFTRHEGASLHCHVGASARLNQVVGDYIAERLFSS